MKALQSGADISMIGQFDVDFYSFYLVADRVQVITKHNDDEQHIWESAATGSFTIALDTINPPLEHGSEISIFLKEYQLEYLEGEKEIKELLKNILNLSKKEKAEVKLGDEYEETKTRIEEVKTIEKKRDNDREDHLAVKHFSAEGQLEFRAIIFVSRRVLFDLLKLKRSISTLKFIICEELTSLKYYVARMLEKQNAIYYIAGEITKL
ncbi:7950_t:CDS:2 [Entrophospora sp. SA101]|nr:7950_t:CDS:2 [Entrophospora sp. SA101]CAJ0900560.1 6588_t:CDS:2 [Entrophospora sp. SA101]